MSMLPYAPPIDNRSSPLTARRRYEAAGGDYGRLASRFRLAKDSPDARALHSLDVESRLRLLLETGRNPDTARGVNEELTAIFGANPMGAGQALLRTAASTLVPFHTAAGTDVWRRTEGMPKPIRAAAAAGSFFFPGATFLGIGAEHATTRATGNPTLGMIAGATVGIGAGYRPLLRDPLKLAGVTAGSLAAPQAVSLITDNPYAQAVAMFVGFGAGAKAATAIHAFAGRFNTVAAIGRGVRAGVQAPAFAMMGVGGGGRGGGGGIRFPREDEPLPTFGEGVSQLDQMEALSQLGVLQTQVTKENLARGISLARLRIERMSAGELESLLRRPDVQELAKTLVTQEFRRRAAYLDKRALRSVEALYEDYMNSPDYPSTAPTWQKAIVSTYREYGSIIYDASIPEAGLTATQQMASDRSAARFDLTTPGGRKAKAKYDFEHKQTPTERPTVDELVKRGYELEDQITDTGRVVPGARTLASTPRRSMPLTESEQALLKGERGDEVIPPAYDPMQSEARLQRGAPRATPMEENIASINRRRPVEGLEDRVRKPVTISSASPKQVDFLTMTMERRFSREAGAGVQGITDPGLKNQLSQSALYIAQFARSKGISGITPLNTKPDRVVFSLGNRYFARVMKTSDWHKSSDRVIIKTTRGSFTIEVYDKLSPKGLQGGALSSPKSVVTTVATIDLLPDLKPTDTLAADLFWPERLRRLAASSPLANRVAKSVAQSFGSQELHAGKALLVRDTQIADGKRIATLQASRLAANGKAASLFHLDSKNVATDGLYRGKSYAFIEALYQGKVGKPEDAAALIKSLSPEQRMYLDGAVALKQRARQMLIDAHIPGADDVDPQLLQTLSADLIKQVQIMDERVVQWIPEDQIVPATKKVKEIYYSPEESLALQITKTYEFLANKQATDYLTYKLRDYLKPTQAHIASQEALGAPEYYVSKPSPQTGDIDITQLGPGDKSTVLNFRLPNSKGEVLPGNKFTTTANAATRAEHELFNKLVNNLKPATSLWRPAIVVNNIQRLMALTGDVAHPTLQLIMMAAFRPRAWFESTINAFPSLWDETTWSRFTLKHHDTIKNSRIILTHEGNEFTEAVQGPPANRVVGAVKWTLSPFTRFYETGMDMGGVLLRESLAKPGMSSADLQSLDTFVNQLRGLQDTSTLGISSNQRALESAVLLAPRYRRATLALYANLANDGLAGSLSREAFIKGVIGIHLITAAVYAAAVIAQDPEEAKHDRVWKNVLTELWNPLSGKYLNIPIGKWQFGPGSKVRTDILFAAKLMSDPKAALDITSRENPIYRWMESQLALVPRTALDLIRGEDFVGHSLRNDDGSTDWPVFLAHAAQQNMLPQAVQVLLEDGALKDRALGFTVALGGLRVRPNTETEAKDALVSSLNIRPAVDQATSNLVFTDPFDKDKATKYSELEEGVKGELAQRADFQEIETYFSRENGERRASDLKREHLTDQVIRDDRLKLPQSSAQHISPPVWEDALVMAQIESAGESNVFEFLNTFPDKEHPTPGQVALKGYYDVVSALGKNQVFNPIEYNDAIEGYLGTLSGDDRLYVERNLYPSATPTVEKYRTFRDNLKKHQWYEVYKASETYDAPGGKLIYDEYLKFRTYGNAKGYLLAHPEDAIVIKDIEDFQADARDYLRGKYPLLDAQLAYWRESIPQTPIGQAILISRSAGIEQLQHLTKDRGGARLSAETDLPALSEAGITTLSQLRATDITTIARLLGANPRTVAGWELHGQIDSYHELRPLLDDYDKYFP